MVMPTTLRHLSRPLKLEKANTKLIAKLWMKNQPLIIEGTSRDVVMW
tara:strand:+ start:238 stop:378 length:141 start_codon:yes stop_codon:yes gene_type:complete